MNEASKSANLAGDLKTLAGAVRFRRTKVFLYAFGALFVACTVFLAFNPSAAPNAPSFNNIFANSAVPYRSQLNNIFSYIFPNSTSIPLPDNSPAAGNATGIGVGASKTDLATKNGTGSGVGASKSDLAAKNGTESAAGALKSGLAAKNETSGASKSALGAKNSTASGVKSSGKDKILKKDQGSGGTVTANSTKDGAKSSGDSLKSGGLLAKNQTESDQKQVSAGVAKPKNESSKGNTTVSKSSKASNVTASLVKQNGSASARTIEDMVKGMKGCDFFDGRWVKDEGYPLYPEGSCPLIDEPFNCYLNGRPDRGFQKLRWKPNGCEIPRLNPTDMLERLRGKRLVFVGDSLNRNMWESLVCILRNSVKDKTKVFEASGRQEFRTVGSYSFIFKDYNCSVEYFRSPFLVQEWEMKETKGSTKETLRLDLIEKSSSKYKNADVIIFNTGHWWTHEKTSKGKDYYQEGNRIYGELNVLDAFHKALNTWAKWVDSNVNPKRSLVFFRGYSASHFSGGQWNSGGQCDKETEPITNDKYLTPYPSKMTVLESVIKGMKTPVSYMNITRMTDYRKDAHPSIYRKQNLTDDERRAPERYQDCSHWCLPGVPDSWNELLYAELLVKQQQQQRHQ